eukprot:415310_1
MRNISFAIITLAIGIGVSSNVYSKHYDFSYLSEYLPEPNEDCTMCFIEICEHAAVWVETKHHNKTTCYSINNKVALLLHQLNLCKEKPYQEIICNHVVNGGITTKCHANIQCFDKELYDSILDCISPTTTYHIFDELFPECLNHHDFISSIKYRHKQITKKHTKTVLREWKTKFFF